MNSKQRRKARRAAGKTFGFVGDTFDRPVLFGLDRAGPDIVRQLGARAKIITIEEAIRIGIEEIGKPHGDGWPLEGR